MDYSPQNKLLKLQEQYQKDLIACLQNQNFQNTVENRIRECLEKHPSYATIMGNDDRRARVLERLKQGAVKVKNTFVKDLPTKFRHSLNEALEEYKQNANDPGIGLDPKAFLAMAKVQGIEDFEDSLDNHVNAALDNLADTQGSGDEREGKAEENSGAQSHPRGDPIDTPGEGVTTDSIILEEESDGDGSDNDYDIEADHRKPIVSTPSEDLDLSMEAIRSGREFIENNLSWSRTRPGTTAFEDYSKRFIERSPGIRRKRRFTKDETIGFFKVALYDFVVLCDDSGSMKQGNRIPALEDTLCRVADLAKDMQDDGISIRFLNFKEPYMEWDHLKDTEAIQKSMDDPKLKWKGKTRLGTVLHKKIIRPMILDNIEQNTFDRPLVVLIVTDGNPEGEDRGKLKRAIQLCKNSPKLKPYGPASVIFVISRVGTDKEAEKFLRDIENDEDLKACVFCSIPKLNADDYAEVMQQSERAGVKHRTMKYRRQLFNLFFEALKGQSNKDRSENTGQARYTRA